jgi:hypothetical protein
LANASNGNTLYVDSTGDILTRKNVLVTYITVTPTGAASVIIQDVTTAATKLRLDVATGTNSVVFDYSYNPILFPNGIRVSTLTNALVTFTFRNTGEGS